MIVPSRKNGRRTFAIRFTAYGQRFQETLEGDGWTRRKAEVELENRLADVRRGIWQPPRLIEPTLDEDPDPTFHEFASEWLERGRHEWSERTIADYEWALSFHLLPHFARHRLSQISPAEVERYKVAKLREGRLSHNSINKTLTRLSQVLEVAVRYELVARNAASIAERCKPDQPRRASLGADQVRALPQCAGRNRALLATAIMAGGLRVSEVTALKWRDVNLADGTLQVAKSKTEAGVRAVTLDPGLAELLAEHKAKARNPSRDAFVFPGNRGRRRDRNAVRRGILYPAIERANALLEAGGLPTIPDGSDGEPRVTFHSLRRTFASLAAEAGIDPAWTKAQIGHKDARFTLGVYTDVSHRRENPAEKVGALIWDPKGTRAFSDDEDPDHDATPRAQDPALQGVESNISGG